VHGRAFFGRYAMASPQGCHAPTENEDDDLCAGAAPRCPHSVARRRDPQARDCGARQELPLVTTSTSARRPSASTPRTRPSLPPWALLLSVIPLVAAGPRLPVEGSPPPPPGSAELVAAAIAARYELDWRSIASLEVMTRRSLSNGDVAGIAPFHANLMPLKCEAQLAVAEAEAAAVADAAGARWRSPRRHGRPKHHVDGELRGTPNRTSLRVAVLRGAANANLERIAALLSLSPGAFAPVKLLTTDLDAPSLRTLQRAGLTIAATNTMAEDGRRHSTAAAALSHTSLRGTSDEEAARLLSTFDLVLDASGHTAGNRLVALASRPAPISASVLGFAGSYGGSGLVDYLSADRLVAMMPGSGGGGGAASLPRRCIAPSERLVLLPSTYQVSPLPLNPRRSAQHHGTAPAAAWPFPSRLPPSGGSMMPPASHRLLLGSFTRVVRWHPRSFELWAAVLLRLGGSGRAGGGASSHLWLLADGQGERARTARELASHGVDFRRRLAWGVWEPRKERHLGRQSAMSVCLDTTPLYGSHTTAADALAASVPLLTVPADFWASRVGASVTMAMGAPQTVARSTRELVDLAELLLLSHSRGHGMVTVAQTGEARASTGHARDEAMRRSTSVATPKSSTTSRSLRDSLPRATTAAALQLDAARYQRLPSAANLAW
jgi:hypothetical protein